MDFSKHSPQLRTHLNWLFTVALATFPLACGGESDAASPPFEHSDAGVDAFEEALSDAQSDAVPDVQDDRAELPEAIEPGVYPLSGVEPTPSTEDLGPVGDLFGSAAVVALGESVHTSGGFSKAKVRLIRYLIEEHDYRVVAFESPRTDAEVTGAYVETCAGTPNSAIANLFGVWANEATVGLLEWMCDWNQSHPSDPLTIRGIRRPAAVGRRRRRKTILGERGRRRRYRSGRCIGRL